MTASTIPAIDAARLAGSNDGDIVNGWIRVGEQDEGNSRWQENYTLVIQRVEERDEYPGIYYGIAYSYGLTEYQDHELPWQPGSPTYSEEIPLMRLYRHRIVQTVYRRHPGKPPVSVDERGDRVITVDRELLDRPKDAE